MRVTAGTDNTSKLEEGDNTGGSAESVVTWLYPQGVNMVPSNETGPTDGLRQVDPEMSNPSMTSAWSSFFSSGGLVSSALNKVSSGEHWSIFGNETSNQGSDQSNSSVQGLKYYGSGSIAFRAYPLFRNIRSPIVTTSSGWKFHFISTWNAPSLNATSIILYTVTANCLLECLKDWSCRIWQAQTWMARLWMWQKASLTGNLT